MMTSVRVYPINKTHPPFEAVHCTLSNHLNPSVLEVLACMDIETAGEVMRTFPAGTWSRGEVYQNGNELVQTITP